MGATGEGNGSKQGEARDSSQQGESAANPDNNNSGTIADEKGIYGFDQDIVQAESAEAPFRKLRLVSYGVLAFIAFILGGVSVAGLAGVEDLKELGENLPNPLLDAAVLGLAFYLWVEEVKTKRSALRLIERRREEKSRVPNRTARRLKKCGGGSSSSSGGGGGGGGSDRRRVANKKVSSKKEAGGVSQTTPSTVTSSDGETAAAAAVGGGGEDKEAAPPAKDGLFEGVRKTLDAVNKQSYYQALALNKELEDKGVLPPLERKPQPPGGQPVVEAETEGLVETSPDQDVSVGTAAPAAVTNEGGGGGEVAPRVGKNTPRKGKGGRKNKRSKR